MNINRSAFFILGITIFLPNIATSQNCTPNFINYDICAQAQNIRSEMAPYFPQRVDSTMVIHSVTAIQNRVTFGAILEYNLSDLQQLLDAQDTSIDVLRARFENFSRTSMCSNETIAAFVFLGGEVEYRYRFLDGSNFTSIVLQNCD